MGKITKNTTLFDLNQDPELAQIKDLLVGGGKGLFYGDYGNMTLEQLHKRQPTWDTDDMLYGIQRLLSISASEKQYVFYPAEDYRAEVQLVYMPAIEKKTDAYVVLCAGGGYGAVCTFVEAVPAAAKLNELGVDCFCLNYRTCKPEHMESGYMPAPLEDLASALRWIRERKERFGIDPDRYYTGGFSAGGHLAALWGSAVGAGKYGLPETKGLLLAYPLIAPRTIEGELGKLLHDGLAGKAHTDLIEELYSVERCVTEQYPPTYLVQCEDDDTVPIGNAGLMEEALKKKNIHHLIERIPIGGHGFGLGSKVGDGKWIEKAVSFLEII